VAEEFVLIEGVNDLKWLCGVDQSSFQGDVVEEYGLFGAG
jgi:hypothetical protein